MLISAGVSAVSASAAESSTAIVGGAHAILADRDKTSCMRPRTYIIWNYISSTFQAGTYMSMTWPGCFPFYGDFSRIDGQKHVKVLLLTKSPVDLVLTVHACLHAEGPARGAYIDSRHTRGGAGILHVTSNPEYTDEEQMFAAGYLEGYLTAGCQLAAQLGSLA